MIQPKFFQKYATGITQSKIDEYNKNQKEVSNIDKCATANKSLKVSNPHTSEGLTDREHINPGHHHKSPECLDEKDEAKRESRTNTDKTTPNSQTLHNPDKPGEQTDTQTSKESKQSENPASTGIRLYNRKYQLQRKLTNNIFILLVCRHT